MQGCWGSHSHRSHVLLCCTKPPRYPSPHKNAWDALNLRQRAAFCDFSVFTTLFSPRGLNRAGAGQDGLGWFELVPYTKLQVHTSTVRSQVHINTEHDVLTRRIRVYSHRRRSTIHNHFSSPASSWGRLALQVCTYSSSFNLHSDRRSHSSALHYDPPRSINA